jgi:hypothetical protein
MTLITRNWQTVLEIHALASVPSADRPEHDR